MFDEGFHVLLQQQRRAIFHRNKERKKKETWGNFRKELLKSFFLPGENVFDYSVGFPNNNERNKANILKVNLTQCGLNLLKP